MVPIGIQSLITQTDASGRAIRPATPVGYMAQVSLFSSLFSHNPFLLPPQQTYTDHSSSSSSSDRRQNRSGILQRWLCCFARVTGGGPTRNDCPPGTSSRGSNSIGVVVSSGGKGSAQRNQAPVYVSFPPTLLPRHSCLLTPLPCPSNDPQNKTDPRADCLHADPCSAPPTRAKSASFWIWTRL